MKKMDSKTHKEIEFYCEKGDEFLAVSNYSDALAVFWNAYDLLPEPKEEWVAGTWILSAIGDVNFLMKEYQAGAANILVAMNYFPSAIDNPFLHLRLGQCFYELGNHEKAKEEFVKVYSMEGDELFCFEDEKYFDSVKSILEDRLMAV